MKIVINKCYGGFSISLEAARYMAKRGSKIAQAEVNNYDDKFNNPDKQDSCEKKYGVAFYGYGYEDGFNGYERNDPLLIEAVEKLGKKSYGRNAELEVVDIPDGVDWVIQEYDGIEWIAEKHRTWS
ncbi:MAG: hypothetical protein HC880_00445 [Bacteroidia bacterium]|nr:hypothetical protein [Bacteroidia bacterium]